MEGQRIQQKQELDREKKMSVTDCNFLTIDMFGKEDYIVLDKINKEEKEINVVIVESFPILFS